jgi:hypothetical protein
MVRAATALMLVIAVACGARGPSTPEGRVCHDVETLYLGGPSPDTHQLALTAKIGASALEISDTQLRAAVEAMALHLTKSDLADPRYLAAALNVCRRKGYLTRGG